MSSSNLAMMQALMALNPKVSQMVQSTQTDPEPFVSPGEQAMVSPMSGGPSENPIVQSFMQQGSPAPPQMGPQPPQTGPQQQQGPQPQYQPPPSADVLDAQRAYEEAQLKFADTQSTRFSGPGGLIEKIRDARKAPEARTQLLDAKQALARETMDSITSDQTQRGDAVFNAVIEAGGSPQMAQQYAVLGAKDPEIAKQTLKDIALGAEAPGKVTDDMAEAQSMGLIPGTLEYNQYMRDANISKAGTVTSYNIPAGYAPDDPNNPNAGIHAIPGSKPWMDQIETEQDAKVAWRNQIAEVTNVLDVAYDAMELVGPTSTGLIGPLMAKIGGTDAADLQEMASTLKANTAFKALFEMRQASKTGGALGNVSNQEIKLLHDSWRSLGQNQSPAQLRKNMQAMIEKFERAKFSLENDDYFRTIPAKDARNLIDDYIKSINVSGEEQIIPGLPPGFEID